MRTRGQVPAMENFYNLLDIARQNPPPPPSPPPPPTERKHFPISRNYFRHAGLPGVFGRKQFSYKICIAHRRLILAGGRCAKGWKNEVVRYTDKIHRRRWCKETERGTEFIPIVIFLFLRCPVRARDFTLPFIPVISYLVLSSSSLLSA